MSRRPPSPPPKKTQVPPSYWDSFLKSQGLVGKISDAIEEQEVGSRPTVKQHKLETVVLTPDQWTFIFRVAESIVPVSGYPSDVKKKLLKTRAYFRTGLEQVFRGTRDFNEWFTDTRQKLGVRELELMELIHDGLEGLRSQEANDLRERFGQVIDKTRMARAGIH